jgi:hypothetical protein
VARELSERSKSTFQRYSCNLDRNIVDLQICKNNEIHICNVELGDVLGLDLVLTWVLELQLQEV